MSGTEHWSEPGAFQGGVAATRLNRLYKSVDMTLTELDFGEILFFPFPCSPSYWFLHIILFTNELQIIPFFKSLLEIQSSFLLQIFVRIKLM